MCMRRHMHAIYIIQSHASHIEKHRALGKYERAIKWSHTCLRCAFKNFRFQITKSNLI